MSRKVTVAGSVHASFRYEYEVTDEEYAQIKKAQKTGDWAKVDGWLKDATLAMDSLDFDEYDMEIDEEVEDV